VRVEVILMKFKSLPKLIAEKQTVAGINISYPSAGVVERIGSDWDWLWLDGQHGQLSYDNILNCIRAADIIGVPSVVRVCGHDYGTIGLALDSGACGVMVPMVENSEQASRIVQAAKFAPLGKRSYGSRRMIDLYGRQYSEDANDDILLIIQIENQEGLENVDEIASVPGVDILFFSPDDISLEMGLKMSEPRSTGLFDKQMERLASVAKSKGKIAGTVAVSPYLIKKAVGMGYGLIAISSDVSIMANGSKQARSIFDDTLKDIGNVAV
jgi:2-keto-3-deoxy-L-rhamnonate aldolase RhmA